MSYALITGASKGIGKALAFELAAKQFDLLLTARSEDLLSQIASEVRAKHNVKIEIFAGDLAQPDFPQQLLTWVQQNQFPVTALVNNAGYANWGLFDEIPLNEQLDMLNLNLSSLVKLCHLFIPELKKHPQSWLMNVSSTTAYQAVPAMSAYAASKVFVLSFTRGLRHELTGTGVNVSCLVPGTTDTAFVDRAKMDDQLRKLADKFAMSPEAVAKKAVKGMLKGRAEIVPGFSNWISAVGTKFVPKSLVERIAANIYLKRLRRK